MHLEDWEEKGAWRDAVRAPKLVRLQEGEDEVEIEEEEEELLAVRKGELERESRAVG